MLLAIEQITQWASSVIWPFLRISAMLQVAPVFGAQSVPTRARLGLGLLLAMIVAARIPPPAFDPLSLATLLLVFAQVIIGVSMALIMQMVFSAVTQAGESVALSMGLGFASVVDPVAGLQVPLISQFFAVLGTLLFLALNGHLVLIELLVLSFRTLPIEVSALNADDLWAILEFASTMFAGSLLIALPLVASMLIVNLALGVVARAATQLNIFTVGFSIMILAGFVLIGLLLPRFATRFGELLLSAFELIRQLLRV